MHKKMSIMVIEDEVLLLQAIVKKLTTSGFDVISCSGGKQAVDYLQHLETPPDLIWLDFYLPDMNGLEFVQQIQKNPEWKKIQIMVVSNSASVEKVTEMRELGVNTYLLKSDHKLGEIVDIINGFAK